MIKKITALMLAGAMLMLGGVSVSAREIGVASTGANDPSAVVAADYPAVGTALTPPDDLPSAYSSVGLGYVSPVRFQRFNTCWAYSSTAALETLLNRSGIYNAHLSTMHMNYWGTPDQNGKGWKRDYSSPGYPYIALGYLTSFGAVTDEYFPDTSSFEEYSAQEESVYPYVGADAIIYLDQGDRDTIKTAVYRYGAATGNFHYDSLYATPDNSAYCCDREGLRVTQLIGHAVAVVGWDDSYSRDHFNANHRPSTDGAWLCKNSWGAESGENGFIWISYEDRYLFSDSFGPSYSIIGETKKDPNLTLKQNERYGATYAFNYPQNLKDKLSKMTYASVFDFSDGSRYIDKIIFESESQGAAYEIYYIPLSDSGVPLADESKWMLLAKGTVDYQGYISANAYGFYAYDDKAAIGVKIAKTDACSTFGIGVDEWLSSGGVKFFDPDTRRGECYLIGYDTEPIDLKDFYYDNMSGPGGSDHDDTGGAFVIKALCRSEDAAGDVDRDGGFTIMDVSASQRFLAGMETPDDIQKRYMDYDNDSDVSIADCTKMQRALNEA